VNENLKQGISIVRRNPGKAIYAGLTLAFYAGVLVTARSDRAAFLYAGMAIMILLLPGIFFLLVGALMEGIVAFGLFGDVCDSAWRSFKRFVRENNK
jgi:hypothetical protein